MSERRLIHHRQNVSAVIEHGQTRSRFAGNDALERKGARLARILRKEFRDCDDARREAHRRHPTMVVGRLRPHIVYWVFELYPQTPKTE